MDGETVCVSNVPFIILFCSVVLYNSLLMFYYHLSCVSLEQAERNWVCEACGTLRGGHGGKIAC